MPNVDAARHAGLSGIVPAGEEEQPMKASWGIGLAAALLLCGTALCTAAELTSAKAELMGRVEDFFMNNFRDVTRRKSLEWSEVQTDASGGRSIRYKYEAEIWDKDTMVVNQVFTFDRDGAFLRYKDVEGFPRKKERPVRNVSTQDGMIGLVENFFRKNFRDITRRETIEWGRATKDEKGDSSIRYKYRATIRNQENKLMNQVFTFDPTGKFISVIDVKENDQ
jgi:hypothetical protein